MCKFRQMFSTYFPLDYPGTVNNGAVQCDKFSLPCIKAMAANLQTFTMVIYEFHRLDILLSMSLLGFLVMKMSDA